MSGRHLYIEDHPDKHCSVTGCGCGWKGNVALMNPVTDGALTAGDASPAGRCPLCDELVYLNRPQDRAVNALLALLRRYNDPAEGPQGSYVTARIRLEDAIGEALGGRAITTTIA